MNEEDFEEELFFVPFRRNHQYQDDEDYLIARGIRQPFENLDIDDRLIILDRSILNLESELSNLKKIDQRYNDLKNLYHHIQRLDTNLPPVQDYERLFDDELLELYNNDVKQRSTQHQLEKMNHSLPLINNFIEKYPEYSDIFKVVPIDMSKNSREFLTIRDFENIHEFNKAYDDYYKNYDTKDLEIVKFKNTLNYIGKLLSRYFKTLEFRIMVLNNLKSQPDYYGIGGCRLSNEVIDNLSKRYLDLNNDVYRIPRNFDTYYRNRDSNKTIMKLFCEDYFGSAANAITNGVLTRYSNNKPRYLDEKNVFANPYAGDSWSKRKNQLNVYETNKKLMDKNLKNPRVLKYFVEKGMDPNYLNRLIRKNLFFFYEKGPYLLTREQLLNAEKNFKNFKRLPKEITSNISEYLFGKKKKLSKKKLIKKHKKKRSQKKIMKKRFSKKYSKK